LFVGCHGDDNRRKADAETVYIIIDHLLKHFHGNPKALLYYTEVVVCRLHVTSSYLADNWTAYFVFSSERYIYTNYSVCLWCNIMLRLLPSNNTLRLYLCILYGSHTTTNSM